MEMMDFYEEEMCQELELISETEATVKTQINTLSSQVQQQLS